MTTKKKDIVLRQLEFDTGVYQEAEEVMASENKRLGLITRKEKINLKGFLPQLVADGIAFRNGNVYVPQGVKLSEPSKAALGEAMDAIERFNKLIS